MTDKPLKPRNEISADELEYRTTLQKQYHEKPLRNVMEFVAEAISKVLSTLGVDVTQSDEMVKQQQVALGITISEHPPEQMGELSGFYVTAGEVPVAIVGDAYLGSDGLAYLKIYWVQKEFMEQFGGVKILQ